MKKILIATTALVATAGVAAADVSMSGEGKAGIIYNSANDHAFWGNAGDSELKFHYNVEVTFEAAGQTDGGLAFGAEITVETGAVGDSKVWFSGSWGKLSFGDVKSGDKAIVGQLPGIEYENSADMRKLGGLGVLIKGDTECTVAGGATPAEAADCTTRKTTKAVLKSSGYTSDGDAVALYEHKIGGFKFALSTSQLTSGSENVGVGVGYETETWNVAVGYGKSGAHKQTTVKAGVKFGETALTAMWRDDNAWTDDYWGLAAQHSFGATKVAAFYADQYGVVDVYGIGASYNLGGGAEIKGGISHASGGFDETIADLGIVFKF